MTQPDELARRAVAASRQQSAQGGAPVGTSTTSAAESLALDHAGYHPVAVISGTSVTRINTNWAATNSLGEVESLTKGMESARCSAIARLVEAAKSAGAAGVVDVRPRLKWHGHRRRHTLELTLLGTAVSGPGFRVRDGEADDPAPFVATLDGVAVSRLAWSGWQPVGLAIGVAVFSFARRRLSSWAAGGWRGGEAEQPTAALYAARESAMARLQADSRRLCADGVLGIELGQDAHVWGRRAVELSAIGTAVARSASDEEVHPPEFAVSLEGVAPRLQTDLRRRR